jgi:DNA-directed RNA polymerase specialized sigma24 family protein
LHVAPDQKMPPATRHNLSLPVGTPPTDEDDEHARLVAALRAQDPTVARPLWDRFAPGTFRVLRRTLGPAAPIDDAVQVVFLCVFHRGRQLRPGTDLGQLVLKVTARVAKAELRRSTVRRVLPIPGSRAARARAARAASKSEHEASNRFYRILDRLSAADRIAFVFHHVEHIEVRVVAAAMGGTVAETRLRLRRALRQVFDGIQRDPILRALRDPP